MVAERRKEVRKTPTEFTFIQLEQEFSGHLVNISSEGLCFETLSPISETPLVQFWFCDRTQGEVDGVGRVMWLNQKKKLGGVKFVHLSRTSHERLRQWVDPGPTREAKSGEEPEREGPADPAPARGEPQANESVQAPEALVGGIALPGTLAQETPNAADLDRPGIADRSDEAVALRSNSGFAAVGASRPEPKEVSNAVAVPLRPNLPPWAPSGGEEADRATAGAALQPVRARPAKWPISRETGFSSSFLPVDVAAGSSGEAASGREDTAEGAETSSRPAAPPATATFDAASPKGHLDPSLGGATREEEDRTASPKSTERDEPEDIEALVTTELVPLNKYRDAKRSQFALGAGVGILICSVILIPLMRYAKQPPRTTLPREPLPRAVSADSDSRMEQSSESIPEAAKPTPSVAGNSKTISEAQGSKRSLTARTSEVAPQDFSVSAPAGPEPPDTRPALESEGKNAVPTPHTFAFHESPSKNRSAPLFEVPKVGNPEAAEARTGHTVAGSSAGQVAPEADLASSSVPFHTKTRVGIPPVGGDVQPAKLIHSVLPDFPSQAKIERIWGDVVLDITIDAAGKVRKMHVLSGHMILREAALRAVGQWQYEPARLDGKPTITHATVTVRFLAK